MEKEWGINTQNGTLLININFFRKLNIKSCKKIGQILFISTDGEAFSILESDFKEIQTLLRENKIDQILK